MTCDLAINLIGAERIGLRAQCGHAGNPGHGLLNCCSVSLTLRGSRRGSALKFSCLFHKGLVGPHDPMPRRQGGHTEINDGITYSRGGARLGEKYKSKHEAKGVSRRGMTQTKMTQTMATARLVSVHLNCPVAKAEMTQK